MKSYRFRKDSWPAFRNRSLWMIPLLIAAVGAVLWLSPTLRLPWPAMLGLVVILLTTLGVGLHRGLRRSRLLWESYEIILDGDRILRRQADTPDIAIQRADVVGVTEAAGQGMALQGPSRFQAIGIPAQVEDYAELANVLRLWGPRSVPTRVASIRVFARADS